MVSAGITPGAAHLAEDDNKKDEKDKKKGEENRLPFPLHVLVGSVLAFDQAHDGIGARIESAEKIHQVNPIALERAPGMLLYKSQAGARQRLREWDATECW